MKAGLITLISEIEKQLERIKNQIESERRIHEAWTKYADCPIKTAVINQCIGVVRGLEVAKESLEFILAQDINNQMSADEWFITGHPSRSEKGKRAE